MTGPILTPDLSAAAQEYLVHESTLRHTLRVHKSLFCMSLYLMEVLNKPEILPSSGDQ